MRPDGSLRVDAGGCGIERQVAGGAFGWEGSGQDTCSSALLPFCLWRPGQASCCIMMHPWGRSILKAMDLPFFANSKRTIALKQAWSSLDLRMRAYSNTTI